MNINLYEILIIFSLSYLITNFATPKIISIANKFGFYDIPDDRKWHSKPIVRLGGIAIALAFFSVLIFFEIINNDISLFNNNKFFSLVIGTLIIFLLGLFDDIYSLSPTLRLGIQFIVSIFLWLGGIRIENLNLNILLNGDYTIELTNTLSLIITSIWLAGFTNALNWIDGVDGLAGGITAICLLGNLFISHYEGNYSVFIGSIVLIGAVSGFLRFNKKPAQILMGDGGSYFLGYSLASISILNYSFKNSYSIIIPISFFMVPLIDMIRVIYIRLSNTQSPFKPDRSHIHHRLIKSGFSDTETTMILYLISLLSLIFGISIFFHSYKILLISIPIFCIFFYKKIKINL